MTRLSYPEKHCSCYIVICLMTITTLFSFSIVFASSSPSFERLTSISNQVQTPTGLALDHQGRLYVAETSSNRVAIFSQNGRFLHAITGQKEPVSVTVGANGRIYIGNKKTGNVAVYDSSRHFLFKLGTGDGEFGIPCAIGVDNTANRIYVADRENSTVKIFNANGSFNSFLGQSGNGNGQFHRPVSVAIAPKAEELIILDWQQRRDTFYGSMINGARIQYFDLNGNFLRSYSKFGYDLDAGQLVSPIHVAVDSASRVYVTDSRRQKVLIYDNTDTFLGLIDDVVHSLRTPVGLAIGATNRLYVSSLLARKVEVYGIGQFSAMDVTPSFLSFQAVEYGANPTAQDITIANNGNTVLSWTAGNQNSWLKLTETSGSIPVSESQSLKVEINAEGLAPGIYDDSIVITLESGAIETINVDFTVTPNPLQITPVALNFEAVIGTSPAGQTLSVSTGYASPVDWTAAADQDWLLISKSSGTTPQDVRVYIDAENLIAASYSSTITFSSLGDDPAPVKVAVTLNLTAPADPPVEPPGLPVKAQNGDKKKWNITQFLSGTSLNGIWGSSSRDIFAVGAEGTILHNDGKEWSEMNFGSNLALHAVWGSSSSDVYAVGDSGLVLHYNGTDWTSITAAGETLLDVAGTESDVLAVDTFGTILSNTFASSDDSGVALRSIWGSSGSDIFVTGEAGAVLHYDGTSWTTMNSNTSQWLNSVWGSSATDVFAVGENGVIVHFDGTKWSIMDSGTTETLLSVWGSSHEDIFTVGSNGLILHFNGTKWTPVTTEVTVNLNDVWVSAKFEVYAVGDDGIIVSGKSKFPWMSFVTSTILINAASKNDDDDKTTKPGLMPTKIQILKGAE